ncbi:hypothetical protein VNO77_27301 [Canavalia gladiata]|uniref:Uncharacterized protein n=1 Tax=Canavalia gladiata TaxID=3824 RepID=A0AAN9KV42_CANGL
MDNLLIYTCNILRFHCFRRFEPIVLYWFKLNKSIEAVGMFNRDNEMITGVSSRRITNLLHSQKRLMKGSIKAFGFVTYALVKLYQIVTPQWQFITCNSCLDLLRMSLFNSRQ